uniref:TSA: Wollemia nobilis Ref_Wollemi_Transcript_2327_1423 transcribed RNA sequence n=1 Tax=Wollemia nobilis TaxID=56998 RepID=A0A0C9RQE3_9CONI
MANEQSLWLLGEQLRYQTKSNASAFNFNSSNSNSSKWGIANLNNFSNNFSNLSVSQQNSPLSKSSKAEIKKNSYYPHKPNSASTGVGKQKQKISEKPNNNVVGNGNSNNNHNNNASVNDKRFKTLPPSESLPRNETLGGYIFVCNNDTMQDDLKRLLFGLPQRFRDSVRAITPGLPLFLYNYTTHQLHGIFEAASFGGTNIDPTAWEDKKCPGESRFPAQVRVRMRKLCKPLEEDAFRPVLYHYDGPKFRLQLNVPETLALLDIFSENGSPY